MRMSIRHALATRVLVALAGLAVTAALVRDAPLAQRADVGPADRGMPQCDDEGQLRLPPGYREWVLVGALLGLSYAEPAPGHQMFHATLMEPDAYRHFAETGTFLRPRADAAYRVPDALVSAAPGVGPGLQLMTWSSTPRTCSRRRSTGSGTC